MFQKVLKNSKILFTTEMINLVAGVLIVVLVARLLDVGALGLYSFSYALGSVLGILCLNGANQWLTREIARNPDRLGTLLGHSLITRSAMAIVLLLLMEFSFLCMGYSKNRILIITALVIVRMFECHIFMLCAFFRAFEEMHYERQIRICLSVISLGVAIPVLVLTRSLAIFSMAQGVLTFLVLVIAYQILVRRYKTKPFANITKEQCVQVFHQGLDFSFFMILLVVYVQTNTILLTFFHGTTATGLYTAGFRFVSALGMIAASSVSALFPAMSRLNLAEHAEEIKLTYLRSTKYLLVISSFFSLFLFIFAPALIQFVYGKSLLPAAVGLRIMAFSVMFSFMNSSSTNLLFSLNKEKIAIRILGTCVVFVIASNFILLPFWGYIGACLTTLLPELVNFGMQYKAISRYLNDASLLAVLWKFVILSIGVVAVTLGLSRTLPLAVQGLIFLAAYALGIFLLRIFHSDEITFVKDRYFRRSPALA